MIHYWKSEDYKALHEAKDFSDLTPIAMRVINRMSQPVVMVLGPISTGGRGSAEENIHLLSAAIDLVYTKGISVFDQNPFDAKMQEFKGKYSSDEYCMELLEDFYEPIYKSGKISLGYFLPDWQTSTGSKWEYEQFKRLGIKTEDFPEEWIKELEQ